jgi:hypothetical protein
VFFKQKSKGMMKMVDKSIYKEKNIKILKGNAMDIFTTQLTRVVQTPIKATSLKVKALMKESGSGGLKEDLDHLENHQYYFVDEKKHRQHKNNPEAEVKEEQNEEVKGGDGDLHLVQEALNKDDEEIIDDKNHLDLYV